MLTSFDIKIGDHVGIRGSAGALSCTSWNPIKHGFMLRVTHVTHQTDGVIIHGVLITQTGRDRKGEPYREVFVNGDNGGQWHMIKSITTNEENTMSVKKLTPKMQQFVSALEKHGYIDPIRDGRGSGTIVALMNRNIIREANPQGFHFPYTTPEETQEEAMQINADRPSVEFSTCTWDERPISRRTDRGNACWVHSDEHGARICADGRTVAEPPHASAKMINNIDSGTPRKYDGQPTTPRRGRAVLSFQRINGNMVMLAGWVNGDKHTMEFMFSLTTGDIELAAHWISVNRACDDDGYYWTSDSLMSEVQKYRNQ